MEPEELVDLLASPDRDRCNEFALVLASQAIPAQIRWERGRWVLSVGADSAAAARRELETYAAESRRPPPAPARPPAPGNPWSGVVLYVALIFAMALIAPDMWLGSDWLSAGRMDGQGLREGDWWRPVTALTLHADAAHLLGNAAFGSFFGYSVARYLGSGFGWFLIVAAGALGNGANGLLSGAGHRSIGASTAVFAALGIVSAYCWRHGFPANASRRERFAPVVAGIGLLAFTGTGGENTDIGAHLTGFVAGFGGGLLAARFGHPETLRVQHAFAAAAIALVVVAWGVALA